MLPAFVTTQHVKFRERGRLRPCGLVTFLGHLLSLLVLCLAFSGVGFPRVADAAPLRVRVRGTAKLVARAYREQAPEQPAGVSDLVLSGSILDDAGRPLALQSMTIRVNREADPHDATVAEGMRTAHGCDRGAADATQANSPSARGRGPAAWSVRVVGPTEDPDVIVMTDEEGRFCFRARVNPDRYKAKLVYDPPAGQALIDGIEREITFDLTKQGLTLRFDPTPKIVPLDTPHATIEAVAILDDEATPRVAQRLPVRLSNEKEELARAVTDASGRARFVVAGAKLGAPGPGELTVSFDGDAETSRAAHGEEIERHIKVAVKVPAADRGELAAGVPEDGIPLVAEIGSSLGPVAEGSVEARVADVVVGTAPVERGIARLTLAFTGQGSEALIRLRYVPTSPWYEPLGEPTIRLPIRGPSLISKAPILLAGLAVLAFFLFGRLSAQKTKPEPAPAVLNAPSPREGKARMELVRPAERGEQGWTGVVSDAHEGTPVQGARVWIERGTFEGRTVVASVATDAKGRFTLPGIGPVAGDEHMAAEAHLHTRLVQDLPAPGEIAIAIAERRRTLLAKLVTWARRRGAPYDVRPEPTPGHIRRAASGEIATARWAEAVERAVFGPGEVDARAELDVESLSPETPAALGVRDDGRARGARPDRDGNPKTDGS